ncbi:LysR family transcriptional regulator [Siculibacillus lacustris]|uniref:LysR family transcriptional regulator n=1 Tax=Siculibacillus lacustris TaxID=1549641 RepID=A0A4Q9VDT7_9HYPH|nr:LysR family transcriptional regulator [Siculibacillus lacustris]TBW32258.1 LysR family transcriptional regulator [Siculibacillus lacustris]
MVNGTQVDPFSEHGELKVAFNWDDVRVFLKVAELGSVRAAASETGLSINAIRRRIEHLEHEIQAILLVRGPSGVELTEEGERVYAVGVDMYRQATLLRRFPGARSIAPSGTVRIGITEGLGSFWMAPRLPEFRKRHSGIQIDLRCEMRLQDISRLEVDFAVQLDPPQDPNLMVARLGYLHIGLFASRGYVEHFGKPAAFEELSKFQFVEIAAEQIKAAALKEKVRSDPSFGFVAVKTNSSAAHAMAIVQGGGIGALPTYGTQLSSELVRIMPEFSLKRDIWLVYASDIVRIARVKAAMDWTKKIFDPIKYPWFRETPPPAQDTESDSSLTRTSDLLPARI